MTDTPAVRFLCIHRSDRSVTAEVLLDHHVRGRVDVRSAGPEPGPQPNSSVVAVLEESGLDLSETPGLPGRTPYGPNRVIPV